jgi:hypothetical protein
METTLQECSEKYNILYRVFGIKTNEENERIYEQILTFCPPCLEDCENDKFSDEKLVENFNIANPSKKIKICNLLFVSKDGSLEDSNYHLMYKINLENLLKCHVCPKCHDYCLSATNNGCYNKKRFENHVKNCTGEAETGLILPKSLLPDVPHLIKNKLFAFLLARNRKSEYPYITNFITFDFEICKNLVNIEVSAKMTCEATLHPISVAWTTVVGKEQTTDAMFIGQDSDGTGVPKLMSELNFINNWLEKMFEEGEKIYNARQEQIDALNLTEEEHKKLITNRETNMRVLGYNSRKFDINLVINNLRDCKVENIVGSTTLYKSIKFSNKNYPFCLQFLDLQSFLSGGSLDDNVRIFTGEIAKGVFPYEILTKENLLEVLLKEEPFEKKDFWSDLSNSSISEERYQEYL